MAGFEYRVVPAPKRGVKARGAKTAEERFSAALAEVMNALGAEGWDYVRSDVLPCEERQGLTGRVTVYHTVLVFRRALPGAAADLPVAKAQMPRAEPAAAILPVGEVAAPAAPAMAAGGGAATALPAFLTPAPRAVAAPLNPAPPLGPAAGRLAAE